MNVPQVRGLSGGSCRHASREALLSYFGLLIDICVFRLPFARTAVTCPRKPCNGNTVEKFQTIWDEWWFDSTHGHFLFISNKKSQAWGCISIFTP